MIELDVQNSFKQIKFLSSPEMGSRHISFDEFEVGSNADTDFVPWYSLFYREYVVDTKDTYIYHKPKPSTSQVSISQYDDLFAVLNGKQLRGGIFYFTIAGQQHYIWVYNGYILDEHFNSLLVLTVKNYYSTEPENCTVLMSSEFITNPIYKNVYKKIESDYIGDAYDKDIEVRTINSNKIDKMLFPSKPPIVYENLTQLTDMMIALNQYFNVDTFAPPIPVVGLNRKVTPLLDENSSVANIMVAYRGQVEINLLRDFIVNGNQVVAIELNKTFDSFDSFLRYAYTHSVGSVVKFSMYMDAYASTRLEFSLYTITNALESHHNGRIYQLEVVDYDVVRQYEDALEEDVQENVNFGEEEEDAYNPF